jgi:predicted nucleotidyltransferase
MVTGVAAADAGVLREAVDRLVSALSPERIYLFGSRARGDARGDSDYDLLVVVPREVERPYRLEQRALAALWPVALPIEVVVLGQDRFEQLAAVAASLPATVQREGVLLYES